MVNWPWAPAAAAELAGVPRLGVGLHLTLTAGPPALPPEQVPSLVGPDGRFRRGIGHLLFRARPAEVRREWEAQVRRFLDLTGRPPTHLDTHHFVHSLPWLAGVLAQVARSAGIRRARMVKGDFRAAARAFVGPVLGWAIVGVARRGTAVLEQAGLRGPDHSLLGDYDRPLLLDWIRRLPPGVTELVCHPGYLDDDLRRLSSLQGEREAELAVLTDPAVKAAVAAAGVELIHYGDL